MSGPHRITNNHITKPTFTSTLALYVFVPKLQKHKMSLIVVDYLQAVFRGRAIDQGYKGREGLMFSFSMWSTFSLYGT